MKVGFRLIAADQFRKANDCCVPKQSLQVNCLIGPLYTSKLPLESDDHPVTALPCADLELSTHSCRSQGSVADLTGPALTGPRHFGTWRITTVACICYGYPWLDRDVISFSGALFREIAHFTLPDAPLVAPTARQRNAVEADLGSTDSTPTCSLR